MGLTGLFGPVAPQEAQRTIHYATALGIRHFDTAELYGCAFRGDPVGDSDLIRSPVPI